MPPQGISDQYVPAEQPSPVFPAPRIGKFKASRMIVSESWALLKQDKEIMLLPVLSSITSFIALIIMGLIYLGLVISGLVPFIDKAHPENTNATAYMLLFMYYIVMTFILYYFQSAIYIIAHGRMNGQNLTLSDGLNGATKKVGKIFVWSVISATVGLLLRLIADRSKAVGKILAAVLGAAWAILTYFSLPALVIGNASVTESFKVSASMIKKTWGESALVTIGAGLFFALLFFAGFAIAALIIVLLPKVMTIVIVAAVLIIYIIFLSILSSSLNSIFKLALYEYASTGKVPQGFSPELIEQSIR